MRVQLGVESLSSFTGIRSLSHLAGSQQGNRRKLPQVLKDGFV
jgi:hypothetical protein